MEPSQNFIKSKFLETYGKNDGDVGKVSLNKMIDGKWHKTLIDTNIEDMLRLGLVND